MNTRWNMSAGMKAATAALLIVAMPGGVRADVAVFGASGDDFMYSAVSWTNRNWGAWTTPQLGIGLNSATDRYRALVRFDVSSLADDVTIDSATLTFTQASNSKIVPANGDFSVRLLLIADANAGWIEGTMSAATAGAGEPCWGYRQYDTTFWTGGAGIGNSTASPGIAALLDTQTIDVDTINVGTAITFAITSAAGLNAIKAWSTNGLNGGFLLATDETSPGQNALLVGSSEHATESYRPSLSVTYTVVPEPSTVSMLGLAALAGLLRRRGRSY